MGFGKAFGFSLLAFIGLNAGFFLIGHAANGTLLPFFQTLATIPLGIFFMFLGPILGLFTGPILGPQFPLTMTQIFNSWITGAIPPDGTIILFVGFIVSPFIAAFLSGRFGEDKIQAFFGWFTTAMLCAVIYLITEIIAVVMIGGTLTDIVTGIIYSIAIGLVYGLAYGSIALLMGREF